MKFCCQLIIAFLELKRSIFQESCGSSEEKKNLSASARWRVLFNYLGMSRTQLLVNQIREFCYGYYYGCVRPTTNFSSFLLSETVCRFRVDDDFQGLSPPCE